jgi:hypothetical protein
MSMTIQFRPRHGRAPGQSAESQIDSAAQACSGSWLRELDDEQLASFGLTPEDILVLRH